MIIYQNQVLDFLKIIIMIAPYQLGEIIHPNLVVKNSFFNIHLLAFCFLCHLLKCIFYGFMKLFFPKMIMAPIICINSCHSFKM